MGNTIPTGQPVPEREIHIDGWKVQELENLHGYNFVTPKGYVFAFKDIKAALDFIVEYQYGGVYHGTKHGDKHYSDSNDISVWTPDPWINKGWHHGDIVCRKQELTSVILEYVHKRWTKN